MHPSRLIALALGAALCSTAAVADQPKPWQLGQQSPATPVMERMSTFHDLLLIIAVAITVLVLALLVYVMWRFRASRNPTPSKITHNTLIEVVWTLVPVLVLVVIAFPSLSLLYYQDRAEDAEMTLIARGYQWYWGYEYPDQQIEEFASYIVPEDQLAEDQVRLLSVDRPIVLPTGTDIQVLITAGDVIHSWAIPAFGVKRDAVPGRMNETWIHIDEGKEGRYYGQCSELCGTDHAYMPIEVVAVTREEFDAWVMEQVAGKQMDEPPVLLTQTYEQALARRQMALNAER